MTRTVRKPGNDNMRWLSGFGMVLKLKVDRQGSVSGCSGSARLKWGNLNPVMLVIDLIDGCRGSSRPGIASAGGFEVRSELDEPKQAI